MPAIISFRCRRRLPLMLDDLPLSFDTLSPLRRHCHYCR